ncbi:hypothetical protein PPL_04320 [Heterostelium album PN500]|uniref:SD-repeat containing protein B domain-containing protein n=1 Tax=Heterostelium pallidum (strain ATCC 26659 / Pp 5 / PN500) TaxID=670386 RepID=D3B785_HETP5|nr:hypothetical protein PPL_04320 [Heterostelium album PN500]EFA82628.1 hypothetical protein PPL_04320 [Heterostelium album PN500]|eukprot:XP_020434745.1 hypothetical protein PPL_04320 [Heterostelium album PN500]
MSLYIDQYLNGSHTPTSSPVNFNIISTVEGNSLIRSYSYPLNNQIDIPSSSHIDFMNSGEMTSIVNHYFVQVTDPTVVSSIDKSIGFIGVSPSKTISFTSTETSEILSLTNAKYNASFFSSIGWNQSSLSFIVGNNQTVIFNDARTFETSENEYSVTDINYGTVEIVNPNLFVNPVSINGGTFNISNDYPFGVPIYSIDGVTLTCNQLGANLECVIPPWTSGPLTKQITSKWNNIDLYNIQTLTYVDSSTPSTTGTGSTTDVTTGIPTTSTGSTSGGSTTGGDPIISHLSALIFNDTNFNNQYDEDEVGLPNVAIKIMNTIVYSNASGFIEFGFTQAGTYSLSVISVASTPYFMPLQSIVVDIVNQIDVQKNISVFWKSSFGCLGSISNSQNQKLTIQYGELDLSQFNYNYSATYHSFSLPPSCIAQKNGSMISVKYKSVLNLYLFIDYNFNGLQDGRENISQPVNATVFIYSVYNGINITRSFNINATPTLISVDIPNNSTVTLIDNSEPKNITSIYHSKYYTIAKPNIVSTQFDNIALLNVNPNNTIRISNNDTLFISLGYGKYNWTFFENIGWNNSLISLLPNADQSVIITSINQTLNVSHTNQSTIIQNITISTIEIINNDFFNGLPSIPNNGSVIQLKNLYWSDPQAVALKLDNSPINCTIESSFYVNCTIPAYSSGSYTKQLNIFWNGMKLYPNSTITYQEETTPIL